MSAVFPERRRRLTYWVRLARNAGWPFALGLGAFVAGLLMLASSMVIAPATGTPVATPDASPPNLGAVKAAAQRRTGDESAFVAPEFETHLDDVAFIFARAREHGVTLGSVDYRTEVQSTLPILVRTLDLRLAEDYPKFKPFVADLLAKMPHLYLQEIRIDRSNVDAPKAQIMLRLALVYRLNHQGVMSDPRPSIAPPAGSAQP